MSDSNLKQMERGAVSRSAQMPQSHWKVRGSQFQSGRCGSQTRAPSEIGRHARKPAPLLLAEKKLNRADSRRLLLSERPPVGLA